MANAQRLAGSAQHRSYRGHIEKVSQCSRSQCKKKASAVFLSGPCFDQKLRFAWQIRATGAPYFCDCRYSRRSAAGSARTKVRRCQMFKWVRLLLLLLLLLLLSLSLPVRYFTPQSSKNRVFSAIIVPLEEKMLVLTMFLQHQGQN